MTRTRALVLALVLLTTGVALVGQEPPQKNPAANNPEASCALSKIGVELVSRGYDPAKPAREAL